MRDEIKAKEKFEEITDIPITYFTNMFLPSFEYYAALSLDQLGRYDEKAVLIGFFLVKPFF